MPGRLRGGLRGTGVVSSRVITTCLLVLLVCGGVAWAKDKKMKLVGAWERLNFTDGLQGFTIKLWTKYLGWSCDQLEIFLATVRRDLSNRKIHAYLHLFVVIGQKPD